jgi:hypothetical protein
MPTHIPAHTTTTKTTGRQLPHKQEQDVLEQPMPLEILAQRARTNPQSLNHSEIVRLQRSIGNHAMNQLLHQRSSKVVQADKHSDLDHIQRTWTKDGHSFDEQLLIDAIEDALEYNDGDHLASEEDFYNLQENNATYKNKPIHTIANGRYIADIAYELALLIFDHAVWLRINASHINNGEKQVTANSVKDVYRDYTGDGRATVWVLKNGENGDQFSLGGLSIQTLEMTITLAANGDPTGFAIKALHWIPHHSES